MTSEVTVIMPSGVTIIVPVAHGHATTRPELIEAAAEVAEETLADAAEWRDADIRVKEIA